MNGEQRRMFGQADLLASEQEVYDETRLAMPALLRDLPGLVDVFLKLTYFLGEAPRNADDAASSFDTLAYTTYVQAPYTVQAIHNTLLRGYYIEAIALLRHLLEGFVRLRYFSEHLDDLIPHQHSFEGNRRDRVSFYRMFQTIAPGFYNPHYVSLSGVSHGPVGAMLWRTHPRDGVVRLGCVYDEQPATVAYNSLLPIVFGFFAYYGVFFPNGTLSDDHEMQLDVADSLRWLDDAMRAHAEEHPQSREFHEHIDRMVRVPE